MKAIIWAVWAFACVAVCVFSDPAEARGKGHRHVHARAVHHAVHSGRHHRARYTATTRTREEAATCFLCGGANTAATSSLWTDSQRATHMLGIIPKKIRGGFDGVGPRPGAWCGWYMQRETGITSRATGRNLNLAAEWRHVGTPASPGVGVIVVWPHHVGKIVGRDARGEWIVRSGNDGHAVRERPRSLAHAIAFRSA
jgi:hypothetical protein